LYLLAGRAGLLVEQAARALGSVPASRRSTVGRDTPANAAMSFFRRPSAYHNTIRARMPTTADTSTLLVSVRSSAFSSEVNSTNTAKHSRELCKGNNITRP
jgi:hypothetical protein